MKALTAYCVVSFYVFGALIIENDVNYTTWYQINRADFRAYHQALESRLQLYLFTPMVIQLVLNGLLIWLRPKPHPCWPFIVTFTLNSYIIGESLLVQVPIHQALAEQYSVALLDQLIGSHQRWRLPAELLVGGINCGLLYDGLRR